MEESKNKKQTNQKTKSNYQNQLSKSINGIKLLSQNSLKYIKCKQYSHLENGFKKLSEMEKKYLLLYDQ